MKIEWCFFILFAVLTFACLILSVVWNGNPLIALMGIISAGFAVHVVLRGDL